MYSRMSPDGKWGAAEVNSVMLKPFRHLKTPGPVYVMSPTKRDGLTRLSCYYGCWVNTGNARRFVREPGGSERVIQLPCCLLMFVCLTHVGAWLIYFHQRRWLFGSELSRSHDPTLLARYNQKYALNDCFVGLVITYWACKCIKNKSDRVVISTASIKTTHIKEEKNGFYFSISNLTINYIDLCHLRDSNELNRQKWSVTVCTLIPDSGFL